MGPIWLAEEAKRINSARIVAEATGRRLLAGFAGRPGVFTQAPGRPVSGHGVLLERRNGCIVKPLEKIVVAVVVADMVKTEIKVLTFEFAAARPSAGFTRTLSKYFESSFIRISS
jgi:hypothetical protein